MDIEKKREENPEHENDAHIPQILMLSKETFCKALRAIQKQRDTDEQFSDALQLVGEGYFFYGFGNEYYNALMMVLKEAVNDQYDYISWWLYEASDDYVVSSADGSKKWRLREPEALYDYIVGGCK